MLSLSLSASSRYCVFVCLLSSLAVPAFATTPVVTTPKVGGLYFYHQIAHTSSTPLPLTITNNQSVELTISSISAPADYPFTTDCVNVSGTGALAPQASCTVQISFDPQAIGTRNANMTVNESAGTLTIPLQGTGIAGTPGFQITVEPFTSCAVPSGTMQFSATVTGNSNTAVNWYVDNHQGGNAGSGTISTSGLYTAPATAGTHGIKAVSRASGSVSGSRTIEVSSAPSYAIYPYEASIPAGGQYTFQPQICGVPDTGAVTYTVDNIPGGNATVGTVTAGGVYTAPAVAGKHTVRVTSTALNETSGAVVNVFSSIAADYGSRTTTTYPIPADMFGGGRGEAMQSTSDRQLLTDAGVTVSRLYAQIPAVYATQTPNWTKIDPMIASIQAAGQHALLQMSYTPTWLQPNPNPCGSGVQTVVPSNIQTWAQLAASYVAHLDANFPGVVTDYEIWNEPNSDGMCGSKNQLDSYISIYSAAAPAMKAQAEEDGVTIRIGGPVLSNYDANWLSALLSNTSTAPYVDFVSYHQYLYGVTALQAQWDTYNGYDSMYEATQGPGGVLGTYNKVEAQLAAGKQPLGANTPVYVTEFNTNWSFYQDCCRNDFNYAPVWNSMYLSDLLDSVYNGAVAVPGKMVYFASNAYPWLCMAGVQDENMDCLYSSGATAAPYPQYYALQLFAGKNYLGLSGGGHMAKSLTPPSGGGGLVSTAFYTPTQDALVITNPTSATYSSITLSLQNVGFQSPHATLYQVSGGTRITSSSVALIPSGAGYTVNIAVPPYSVQAISLTE